MRREDDCTLTPGQLHRVRNEAERALREAGALGTFPTPIEDIMSVARVEEVKEDVLEVGFLARLRSKAEQAGQAVKLTASKVLGVFLASAGLVFLNQKLMAVKKRFVGFHEAAHGFLPWQRPMYALVEDCEKAPDGATAELFDREANVFASEVLFQVDTFREMAADEPFEIWTPVRLAKKFNASNYAAIRQYVSKSDRACAVVVLNMPEPIEGHGFRATLRRAIQSTRFTTLFGEHAWPDQYTPDDKIGALVQAEGIRQAQPRTKRPSRRPARLRRRILLDRASGVRPDTRCLNSRHQPNHSARQALACQLLPCDQRTSDKLRSSVCTGQHWIKREPLSLPLAIPRAA